MLVRRLHASARELLPLRMTALQLAGPEETPRPDRFAHYGDRSWIVPPATIDHPEHISMGADAWFLEGANLVVQPDPGVDCSQPLLVIGERVRLGRFAHVRCTIGVTIGDAVSGSDEVTIVDSWMPGPALAATLPAPAGSAVVIGRGAYLGARSVVGPGVTVGEGAFVGEGAVLLDDVPPHAVVYGNPARVIRQWNEDTQAWETTVP
jgi:acetyltransferase-like isoleucine patch superfamily enzyme